MRIELHPDAQTSLNSQAVLLIQYITERQQEKHEEIFKPNFHIVNPTNPLKITDIILNDKINSKIISMFIPEEGKDVGFFEEGHQKLELFINKIYKMKEFNHYISMEFLTKNVFEWAIKTYQGKINIVFIDYIINKSVGSIKPVSMLIPIHGLSVQSSFACGKTLIVQLNQDIFDDWEDAITKTKDKEQARELLKYYRRKTQGYAACLIEITAEQSHALNIGLEEAENATTLLRIFLPSILTTEYYSICRPFGKEDVETKHIFYFSDIKDFPSFTEGFLIPPHMEKLDNNYLQRIHSSGFQKLHDLYLKENKTEFQSSLLNSLFVYSKSSLKKEISERLIYIFTALDSFLLKNQTENIQQNIGERIAFTICDNADDRIQIKNDIINAYAIRSRVLHHNQSTGDIDQINKFINHIFRFFIVLLNNNEKYISRSDYFNEIDRKKFS